MRAAQKRKWTLGKNNGMLEGGTNTMGGADYRSKDLLIQQNPT
jgi:hypothetical protein